jgi:polysaccharide biosynthesis protein PslJ
VDGLIARRMPSGWQLYLLIGLYPVLWGLGLAYFVWPVAAGVFVLSLCLRAPVRVPPGFGIWALFLMWMLFSAIELSTTQQAGLFAWRAVIYLTATGVFLWIYNATADALPDDTVASALTVLWALAVVGGLVGVFDPTFSFHTLGEALVPKSILNNPTAYAYVHPALAQIQFKALGHPIGRPITLFAYTNQWAATVGVLTPFAVITTLRASSPIVRKGMLILFVVAAIPIIVSINRGLWIALIIAVIFVGVRLAAARHARLLMGGAAVTLVLAAIILVSPLGRLADQRISSSHNSNGTRATLYSDTFSGTSKSPLFGFGTPRASANLASNANVRVGTQGQFYLILFSHGYPGLVFYLGWFGFTFLLALRRRSLDEILWESVILISFVEMMVYDFLPAAIYVVMIACALLWRRRTAEAAERQRAAALMPPQFLFAGTPPRPTAP